MYFQWELFMKSPVPRSMKNLSHIFCSPFFTKPQTIFCLRDVVKAHWAIRVCSCKVFIFQSEILSGSKIKETLLRPSSLQPSPRPPCQWRGWEAGEAGEAVGGEAGIWRTQCSWGQVGGRWMGQAQCSLWQRLNPNCFQGAILRFSKQYMIILLWKCCFFVCRMFFVSFHYHDNKVAMLSTLRKCLRGKSNFTGILTFFPFFTISFLWRRP